MRNFSEVQRVTGILTKQDCGVWTYDPDVYNTQKIWYLVKVVLHGGHRDPL